MKVKVAALTMLVASYSFASEGPYVGVDLTFANETELKVNSVSITEDNDIGFNLLAGYDMPLSNEASLGLELEYRTYDGADFEGVLKTSGNAFFVNAAPKYFINDNFYIGATLGFGQLELEVEVTDGINKAKDSETGTAFQYGIQAGYVINSALSGTLGYRSMSADVDGVDTTISGLYAGLRYSF